MQCAKTRTQNAYKLRTVHMAFDINNNSLDVIKCVTGNDVLVTKSGIENFNTKSQLIVNEAQEALFYKDGQALDLFGSGRHSLTTDNLPFFKKLYGAIFGSKTPFSCEVFFINKVSVMDIMWGTDAPIVLEDPKYNLIVGVKANGQTGIRVKDSRKFVVKVVGQLREFTVDSVRRAIKGMMMTNIKEIIASTIIEKKVTILEITTKLSEISAAMQEKLNVALDDLGLEAVHFYAATIFADENDIAKLRQAKEKQLEVRNDTELEAYKLRILSEARAHARAVEGYSYQDERKFDVLETAASNSGNVGGMVGAGLGFGMGLGMVDETKKMTAAAVEQPKAATRACPNCQSEVPVQSKFCPECGNAMPPAVKFCSECGSKLAPGSKFCPECGTKVQ